MKNTLLYSTLFIVFASITNANANQWWLQPTVCKLDTTKCYIANGTGIDSEIWDADSNCRGMKYICPKALSKQTNLPQLMSRTAIEKKTGISSDFDTDLLDASNECFGRRKTNKDGTMAMVNGKYQNIWCTGILNTVDETLSNGEIVYEKQPTCAQLAQDGYAAVLNGKCFGKYYDSARYYIECGNSLTPNRLIILNGAEYNPSTNTEIATKSDAEKLFEKMYTISQQQKSRYFSNY